MLAERNAKVMSFFDSLYRKLAVAADASDECGPSAKKEFGKNSRP